MNDVFGNPFEGHLSQGWSGELIHLKNASHKLEFFPGKRQVRRAIVALTDTAGRQWQQVFETPTPPWMILTMGYHPGSWKDGGNFFTYHGSEGLALEWDDFDFSNQPVMYKPYGAEDQVDKDDGFGIYAGYREPIYGLEYNAKVTTTAPDGTTHIGSAQLEVFLNPPYKPYGLT
jgi:hypothetical protein